MTGLNVEVRGLKSLRRALRERDTVSETLVSAMQKVVDETVIPKLRAAAPSQAIADSITRGNISMASRGTAPRARIKVKHPSAASFEFGRVMYYRGYKWPVKGKKSILKQNPEKFRSSPGFQPRPWIGIKGGGVLGEVDAVVRDTLTAAMQDAWSEIGDE